MHPRFGPVPAFAVGYCLAFVLGGGSAVWLMRRAGLRAWQSNVVLIGLVISVLVGSKIVYLMEAWPQLRAGDVTLSLALWSAYMRIPGGFVLEVVLCPLFAWLVGVRPALLADTYIPSTGFCMVGVRVGCFLEGCCYGTPSTLPWAVRFPVDSSPYWWQVQNGIIALGARTSVPVHPLQLYFAVAGLIISACLIAYQPRKRFDGEVVLLFLVSFFWSTWLLELLRASPHMFTRNLLLAAGVAAAAVALPVEYWARFGSGCRARAAAA